MLIRTAVIIGQFEFQNFCFQKHNTDGRQSSHIATEVKSISNHPIFKF
jgi:hypothetical protein